MWDAFRVDRGEWEVYYWIWFGLVVLVVIRGCDWRFSYRRGRGEGLMSERGKSLEELVERDCGA